MGQPFTSQHPAVVLRSHFKLVRGLLAVAMAAVLALSAVVVILANDDDQISGSAPTAAAKAAALPNSAVHSHPLTTAPAAATRYDGGPEEGTRSIIVVPIPDARYDGGPDEGSRSIAAPNPGPAPERTAGGSAEESSGEIVIPQGPGGPR